MKVLTRGEKIDFGKFKGIFFFGLGDRFLQIRLGIQILIQTQYLGLIIHIHVGCFQFQIK